MDRQNKNIIHSEIHHHSKHMSTIKKHIIQEEITVIINGQYQTNQHSRQYQLTNRSRQLPPFNKQQIKRGKNPCDRNGIQLRCKVCESIYHMAQNCPEKRDIYHTQEIILFQSDYDHPDKLKNLSSETWNTALLDSGATNTVAGKEWYNC